MYLIKHRVTHQYLQKWFVRDKFGHWSDNPKLFNKQTKDKLYAILGDNVEIIYQKRGK